MRFLVELFMWGCFFTAMSSAAKSFYNVLKETYEEDWYDPHAFNSSLNVSTYVHVYMFITWLTEKCRNA